ncbi:MAG TPA: aminopeptidase P family protein [Firmicutes bacterium]|nr:aminopeptidase P family protein [Bacillota bacterium]
METTPKKEIESRIAKLQGELQKKGIDGALITQNADLFYFTGSCQKGHLVVPAKGEACYLVTRSFDRAKMETPLARVEYQRGFKELPAKVQEIAGSFKKLGMELDVLPTALYLRYRDTFTGAELVDISLLIRELRMYKSSYELGIMRKGAEVSQKMLQAVPHFLKAGKREIEFAADLEHLARTLGHQGAVRMRQYNQEVFYGHIMSGANITFSSFFDGPTGGPGLSPAYPQGPGRKVIEKGDVVLVDYVAVYGGYCVDNTRIFCLGDPPGALKKAHRDALLIHDEVIEAAKPGVPSSELAKLAFDLAREMGYEENFMGYGSEKAGFVGHGVGLELDELPVLTARQHYPLAEGMVFALEPKILFKGSAIAGIENTVYFNGRHLEKLVVYPEEIVSV